MRLNIGDRVRINDDYGSFLGATGTVYMFSGSFTGIKFDSYQADASDLDHNVDRGYGWFFMDAETSMTKIESVPTRKITVAEIEKALGYGVEIVKEGK